MKFQIKPNGNVESYKLFQTYTYVCELVEKLLFPETSGIIRFSGSLTIDRRPLLLSIILKINLVLSL